MERKIVFPLEGSQSKMWAVAYRRNKCGETESWKKLNLAMSVQHVDESPLHHNRLFADCDLPLLICALGEFTQNDNLFRKLKLLDSSERFMNLITTDLRLS